MRKWHVWAAVLAAGAVTAYSTGTAVGALTDTAGHWAAPLIAALEAKGVVAGDLDGRFNPDAPLNRAQMAKLLVAGLGNDAEAQLLTRYDSRFADIPAWHWAKGYVEALAETGITDGYPDGSFGPNDTVTRAQMAVFLVRAMGLSAEAQLMRFMPTDYTDDPAIPDWARGSVHLAQSTGLMSGFPDGSFAPLQSITKAEGGVVLLRLMVRKGLGYHLTGTLVRFDSATGQGVVRNELGREVPFTMTVGATYFRSGAAVQAALVRPADQVWIVLDKEGRGLFLEARYTDRLLGGVDLAGNSLTTILPGGQRQEYRLTAGTLFFVNGRPATREQLAAASPVYLVLDVETQAVRIADGVRASIQGTVSGANAATNKLFVTTGGKLESLTVAPETIIYLNGERAGLQDLRVNDRVWLAQDPTGLVTYLQAER